MPFSAKNLRLKRKSISVCMRSVARKFTSPPRPPSPPSGPPACTYFSRWKETQPLPPSPALTVMLTMSTNKRHSLIRSRFRKAPSFERAAVAFRAARVADAAAVPDEQMVRVRPVPPGEGSPATAFPRRPGVVASARPMRRETRNTCVSTGIWSSPKAASSTTPAVFCPTPGRAISSARVEGTLPPCFLARWRGRRRRCSSPCCGTGRIRGSAVPVPPA